MVTVSALVACLFAFFIQHRHSPEMRANNEHKAEVESVAKVMQEFSNSL